MQVFHGSNFFLEIFLKYLIMHCLKCLFHIDDHINLVGSGMFVETLSRWNGTSENKKALDFLGSQSEISITQTYLTKSQRQTNDQFSHYCNSSVESFKLLALGGKCIYVQLIATTKKYLYLYIKCDILFSFR